MPVTLRKFQLPLLVALLIICSGCSRETTNPLSGTKSVSGKVVKIVDGDTITILDAQNTQHKIRLQGIDAPERKQDFSKISREHLASLVFGKQVRVDYAKVDRWGRLIGKVWIDGNDECLAQIQAGLAWHYKEYEREQSSVDREAYAAVEQEARAQKRGLWKDPAPTPPWDFRHHKTGSPAENDLADEPPSDDKNINSTAPAVERKHLDHPPGASQLPNQLTPSVNPEVTGSSHIRGSKHSKIYHWPGCPNYDAIAPHNRVPFPSREEAEKAGYRAARNCR
ncbi:MAG: thermonuclease family protein [Pyrinomonadaceae bacterium]|nr:thermonuclease family protein [Pyrinomonadaceae bacterium]